MNQSLPIHHLNPFIFVVSIVFKIEVFKSLNARASR